MSYESACLVDSPVFFWLLNEASGTTAADATGNGNTGTYTNSGSYTLGVTGPPGAGMGGNKAVSLTGNANAATGGQVVAAGTYTNYSATSAEIWFKTANSYATGGALWQRGDSNLVIYMLNNGTITFGIWTGSSGPTCTTSGTYNDGNWHYLVATYDSVSTNMYLYIDNVQVATTTASAMAAGDNKWYVANGGNVVGGWPGTVTFNDITATVADAAIYPAALTPTQIANHWNAATAATVTSSHVSLAFSTGRTSWNLGAPVQNPQPGPVFRPKPAPVKAQLPRNQFFPRGRIGSSATRTVQVPATSPPVYPLQGPVRAKAQPRAGLNYASLTPAVTPVLIGQAGIPGGDFGTPQTLTYASKTGNTLIITGHLYNENSGDSSLPVSITDTAGNQWNLSTSNAQTPPTYQVADTTDGGSAFQTDFVAWCVNAAAVTSVTIAVQFGHWWRLALSEWSGIARFSNSWAGGSSTGSASPVSGPVTLSNNALVVGNTTIAGSTQSVPAGWTTFTSEGGGAGGYYLAGIQAGSYSPVWTANQAGSWSSAVAVFTPVTPTPPSFSSGRISANFGAPPQNPQSGPVFRQKTYPVRARITAPARGRTYSTPVPAVKAAPSSGPPVYPLKSAVRAKAQPKAGLVYIDTPQAARATYTAFGVHGNGATGPASSTSLGSAWVAGTLFEVTSSGYQLSGYGQWITNDGTMNTSLTFALWQATGAGTGTLVANSGATISTLTPGTWQYVSLATPIALTPNTAYKVVVCSGSSGCLPFQGSQFGNGDPYAAGITNGPLNVFSAASGSNHDVYSDIQSSYQSSTSSPTAAYPNTNFGDSNAWIDVQITAVSTPAFASAHATGRTMWSAGAPVNNPSGASVGPPVYPQQGPVRARLPLPRRGICRAIRFGPLPQNPQAGPVFVQKTSPVRSHVILPPRGRISSGPGAKAAVSAVAAPIPLTQPVGVRVIFLRTGSVQTSGASPVRNPQSGPVFHPVTSPVRSSIPQNFSKGRVYSNSGAPVRNPHPGPVFVQKTSPVRSHPQLPPRGRIASNRGGPVSNPAAGMGPVFRQATAPARIRPSLPIRGRIVSNRGAPLQNPQAGPPFRQATKPASIRFTLPSRGRIYSNPGSPVSNPVVNLGPPVYPQKSPARIRPSLPLRGRIAFNRGAPVHNPQAGPVFVQAVRPIQVRIPQVFSKGRVYSNPGGPVSNPVTPPPVYPLKSPVRIHPQLPPRGRIISGHGGPVLNPVIPPPVYPLHFPVQAKFPLPPRGRVYSNPGTLPPPVVVPAKIYPLHGPVQARRPLPLRGRVILGNKGAAVSNPQPGPVFRQAVRPIRAVIPQNAPRGRVSGNPGGPVQNIPQATLVFRYGDPHYEWSYGDPASRWSYGDPQN